VTLEFDQVLRALEEHIEILKQELLVLTAQCKLESTTTQITTVKRDLDKAVEQRMKLSRIYCSPPLPISSG
jgi:Ni,Fe-hydrogenase maturation factor